MKWRQIIYLKEIYFLNHINQLSQSYLCQHLNMKSWCQMELVLPDWVKNSWDFRKDNTECANIYWMRQGLSALRSYLSLRPDPFFFFFSSFLSLSSYFDPFGKYYKLTCLVDVYTHSVLQAQFSQCFVRVCWPHWVILISLQGLYTFSVARKG